MMGNSPDSKPLNTEQRAETERKLAPLTVYLIRHGESTVNKNDPARELTDLGKEQVRQATNQMVAQLKEQMPSEPYPLDGELGKMWDKVNFRIYDSETPRTMEQAQIEKEVLLACGVPEESVYILHPNFGSDDKVLNDEMSGPGLKRRIGTVTESTPEFRKRLDDPEYQRRLGAADGVIAWMLTPNDEVPAGVQNYGQVQESMKKTGETLERLAKRIEDRGDEAMVVIANSHAPRVTVAMASTLDIDPREMEMVGNAEGLRLQFDNQSGMSVDPFKLERSQV